jgi:type IV pilus assembly protein PilA
MKKSHGFTLIELMTIIIILGILAAIAIPKFMDASTKAKFGEIPVIVASYDHAQLARLAETASLAAARSDLIMDDPANSKWFTYSYSGVTGNSSTYSAGVQASIAVGTFGSTSVSATSIITTAGNPVHSAGDFKQYLPMFQ